MFQYLSSNPSGIHTGLYFSVIVFCLSLPKWQCDTGERNRLHVFVWRKYWQCDTSEWRVLHVFIWGNILAVWHRFENYLHVFVHVLMWGNILAAWYQWEKYFICVYVGQYIGSVTLMHKIYMFMCMWAYILAVGHLLVKYLHVFMRGNILAVWMRQRSIFHVSMWVNILAVWHHVFICVWACVNVAQYIGNVTPNE